MHHLQVWKEAEDVLEGARAGICCVLLQPSPGEGLTGGRQHPQLRPEGIQLGCCHAFQISLPQQLPFT